MNKCTLTLTETQYKTITALLRDGYKATVPNPRAAMILTLQATLGLRIGDLVQLRLSDIVQDGSRYRLDIAEDKTDKRRLFTVPAEVHQYIADYAAANDIKPTARLFPVTVRAVQIALKNACDHLGYKGIGTHSFRKYFATRIYLDNGYNLLLVQTLLQHSSPTTTQRYIGIGRQELEAALQRHIDLLA